MSKHLLTYDLGKRAIYNYFVLDSSDNRKANLDIVNAWYPKSAKQEEIFILQKLLSLAHGKDGEKIKLNNRQFQLTFMVSDQKAVYKKTGEFVGYQRDSAAMQRALCRFNDFKARGLVEGGQTHLCITFSGRLELEEKLCRTQEACNRAQHAFEELAKTIENSIKDRDLETKNVIGELHSISELLKEQNSPSISKALSTIDTTTSILEKLTGSVPVIANLIHEVVSLFG